MSGSCRVASLRLVPCISIRFASLRFRVASVASLARVAPLCVLFPLFDRSTLRAPTTQGGSVSSRSIWRGLRHLGGEQCGHGLTSRPKESCCCCWWSAWPACGSAADLSAGSLRLRYHYDGFGNRTPSLEPFLRLMLLLLLEMLAVLLLLVWFRMQCIAASLTVGVNQTCFLSKSALTGYCNQRHWPACRRCREWYLCPPRKRWMQVPVTTNGFFVKAQNEP